MATLHRVFKALDVAAFEAAVGGWLARTGIVADDALALDGKTLRGVRGDGVPGVHLVGAYAHGAQTMLAQLRSAGKGHELAAAKHLLCALPVAGGVVTGDALLTQREVSRRVVAGGGDYLLPADENQPRLRAGIAEAFSPWQTSGPDGLGRPAAGPCHARDLAACGGRLDAVTRVEPKARHGRREVRMLWALHDPAWNAQLGWPHLAQVCRVERRRSTVRAGREIKAEVEVS